MVFIEILIISVSTIFCVLAYFKWSFGYWRRRNVPFRTPSIPLGNVDNFLTRARSIGHRYKDNYDYFKARGCQFAGVYIFASPVFIPIDPEYVKSVLVKDFDHFTDRGVHSNEKRDPLSQNVFIIGGKKWKNYRTKLSPVFSSGKIKLMCQTVIACVNQMACAIDEKCQNNQTLDLKDMMACFTTDVIASCAFGWDCNSCLNPNEPFREIGREFMKFGILESISQTLSVSKPNISELLGIRIINKDISNFLLNSVKNTVEYREKNNYSRKDFIQQLIELRNRQKNLALPETIGMKELTAHALTFFIGGFETSASTLTFAIFEMALNEEIQNKARDEVREVLAQNDGELNYDCLKDLKYLQQIIDESLRKYPILPLLTRKCVKEYQIPNTHITLDKDTITIIPVLGLHYDPEYWPNPEVFDPERFNVENKGKIQPFTYLPFGEGPRICIGLRFGLMQTKIGLATFLNKYRFSVSNKTELPLKYRIFGFSLDISSAIHLNIENVS